MEKVDFLKKFFQILDKYLSNNSSSHTPVINYQSAKNLESLVDFSFPEVGDGLEKLEQLVEEYFTYSVRTSHPQFNNQLNGGFSFPALIGELVSFITNTSMATYEIAPLATLIEKKLATKLGDLIGYTNAEGIMVTGGSNANMMAIHCARNQYDEQAKEKGNRHQYAVFVSKQAHYSFKKAVNVLGIGIDNLYVVQSDDQGKMLVADLEDKIDLAKKEKKIPLIIASTAGTTVLGVFDPIKEIDRVAKKNNIWHHIDGAWGAPVLFSKQYSHLIEGASLADSFTWDAHKLMGAGLITSFFLTKKHGVLSQANSGGGKKYLFHEYENADYDTGHMSLQCGRKVDCIKLWFAWKTIGSNGYRDLVDKQFEKAQYFKKKIEESKNLQLVHTPSYLNVCFQVIPKDDSIDINKYNLDLRFKLVKEGMYMINFSSFDDGTIFFRKVFANPNTTFADIDLFIERILDY